MGWRQAETKIEQIREKIGENPREARDEIDRLLRDITTPSHRVRLYGLLVAACKTLGDFQGGEEAWEKGKAIGGSAMAKAELTVQASALRNAQKNPEHARQLAQEARKVLAPLLPLHFGASSTSLRRRSWIRTLYSWTFYYQGNASLISAKPLEALREGLEALRWIDHRSPPKTYLGALSIIAIAVARGAGSADDIENIIKRCHEAARLLRPDRMSIAAVKLRWIRALCLARLGVTRLAETLLVTVIADLRSLNAADWEWAAMDLLWIVAERAGQYSRARYLCHSLALPPEAVPPAPLFDVMEPPIGF